MYAPCGLRSVEQRVDRHAAEAGAELRPLGHAVDVARASSRTAARGTRPRSTPARRRPCRRCGSPTRSVSSRGVGPAVSTGKPRSTYCPGGTRSASSSGVRRRREPSGDEVAHVRTVGPFHGRLHTHRTRSSSPSCRRRSRAARSASPDGGKWCHLRICLDAAGTWAAATASPGRHATAHAGSSGHPIIRSIQPGEDWSWCFVDEVAMVIPQVEGETQHPALAALSLTADACVTGVRITHIGGPTVLIEIGGWRLLTDPTFDSPGRRYGFGWGTASRKLAGPAIDASELAPIDAVLLSHDHHGDNLDPAGRALLPAADVVVTTVSGARRLGGAPADSSRGRPRGSRRGPADDRDHGHAVPPRAAAHAPARGRRDRLRAALGGPGARRAVDLGRHRALRRRARGGRRAGGGHRAAASGRRALPGDRAGALHDDRGARR